MGVEVLYDASLHTTSIKFATPPGLLEWQIKGLGTTKFGKKYKKILSNLYPVTYRLAHNNIYIL